MTQNIKIQIIIKNTVNEVANLILAESNKI